MYLKCIFKVRRKMENLVCYKTLPVWQNHYPDGLYGSP